MAIGRRNRWHDNVRQSRALTTVMRDINKLEGFKADQTLETSLTPQYGIIIGGGSTLTQPQYCDVDSSGNIFVSDASRKKIVKFTAAGNYVSEFGTTGTSPGEFQDNRGIALDSSNNIFVVDGTRNKCIKFNSSGTYQSEFSTGTTPSGIDIDSSNNIYVGIAAHAVEKYNSSGTLQTTYDSITTMGVVWDVAVTSDGATIYVATTTIGVGTPAKIVTSGPTYSNIGTLGTGSSQFQAPTGVAIDGLGNHYYSDSTRNKVIKYDSTDTFVLEFGTTGTNPGEFQNPYGIGLQLNNDIIVIDNSRAKAFIFKPVFTRSFQSISIPSNGFVYDTACNSTYSCFTDNANKRVVIYTTSPFSYNSQINSTFSTDLFSVDIDTSNNVYVVGRSATEHLKKYSVAGSLLATAYISTSYYVTRVCCTPSGDVLVSGRTSGNIPTTLRYNSSLVLQDTYTHSGISGLSAVRDITTFSDNSFAILSSNLAGRVHRFNSSGVFVSTQNVFSTIGSTSPYTIGSTGADYIVLATATAIYVLNSSNIIMAVIPKYTGYGSISCADANTNYLFSAGYILGNSKFIDRTTLYGPASYSYSIEMPDTTSSTISAPEDAAINTDELLITDKSNNRVLRYNKDDGTVIGTFGSAGSGNGQFNSPRGIDVDASGNIYVADYTNNRIQKFSSTGTYSSKFGINGSGNGEFDGPSRLVVDQTTGEIYVTDKNNARVQVFDSSGSYLRKYGTNGSTNGKLNSPLGITKHPTTGHVYVVNSANNRIEVYEEFSASKAKFKARFGESGSGEDRQFSSPEGIAVDSNGHIFIADTGNNRIYHMASNGRVATVYGSSGSGDGQFSSPSSLVVDDTDLYVVDRGNNRIHKFIIASAPISDVDTQTVFSHYTSIEVDSSRIIPMGNPDRGKHVPSLEALEAGLPASELDGAVVMSNVTAHISTARKALERLAASQVFSNRHTGMFFNWNDDDENLYRRSLENRHGLFGVEEADGDLKRTWTRGHLIKQDTTDLDIGELHFVVDKLKDATLGVVT